MGTNLGGCFCVNAYRRVRRGANLYFVSALLGCVVRAGANLDGFGVELADPCDFPKIIPGHSEDSVNVTCSENMWPKGFHALANSWQNLGFFALVLPTPLWNFPGCSSCGALGFSLFEIQTFPTIFRKLLMGWCK